MTECVICAEKYNKSFRLAVKCICDFECCRACVKQYLLTKSEDAHCMHCKVKWNRDFMYKNFEKKYIAQDYRVYRENILYEKELGLLPLTQPYVEKEIKVENIQKEIQEYEKEFLEIRKKIDVKRSEIFKLRNDSAVERRKYVRKCPKNDCQGFLSSQLKCELCNSWVCSECREIKGQDRDAEHTCNPEILESVRVMNQDSKPCPNCASLIYKIEGCSQMFCTECNTAFNWNTLRIETGAIHNPHYFEWQRRQNQGQQAERNPNEVLCGRELDHNFTRVLGNKLITDFNSKNSMTNQEFIHKFNQYFIENYPNLGLTAVLREISNSSDVRIVIHNQDHYNFVSNILRKINRVVVNNFRDPKTEEKIIVENFVNTLKYQEYRQKINLLENIIRRIIHIREVEMERFGVGDRISNNLDLRIAYMRNRITAENMKIEVQKRDKKLQRNTEIRNVFRMFISCVTDLFYRMSDNIEEYDNILKEMDELRLYTNQCMLTIFTMYGSSMRHHIGENYTYIIT